MESLLGAAVTAANSMYERGEYAEAADAYKKLLDLPGASGEISLYINRGSALRQAGKVDEAAECYEKALELNPKSVDALFHKGNLLHNQGKVAEALPVYEAALVEGPTNEALLQVMSNCCNVLGKHAEAVEFATRVLEVTPSKYETRIERALAYMLQGNLEACLADCVYIQEHADADGDSPRAKQIHTAVLVKLARAATEETKFEEAVDLYSTLIALEETSERVFNKAVCLAHLSRDEEAITAFLRTLELDPSQVGAMAGLAFEYLRVSNWEKATEYFDKAFEAGHSDATARYNNGVAYMQQGDAEGAIENMEKALELDPELSQAQKILDALRLAVTQEEAAAAAAGDAGADADADADPTTTETEEGEAAPSEDAAPTPSETADLPATAPTPSGEKSQTETGGGGGGGGGAESAPTSTIQASGLKKPKNPPKPPERDSDPSTALPMPDKSLARKASVTGASFRVNSRRISSKIRQLSMRFDKSSSTKMEPGEAIDESAEGAPDGE